MSNLPYPKMYLYRRVVQAKLFMDSHYAEPIVLADTADEAYFSKFHFLKLFKNIYRMTPHQYLISVRLEKARELLRKGTTVSEACNAVGFESVSSFSGLFKRKMGLTPSHYHTQQEKIRAEVSKAPLRFIPGCFAEKNGWTKKSQF